MVKYESGTTTRLAGVTFALYRDSNFVSRGQTNAEGRLEWLNLAAGNYVIVEEDTLPGYAIVTASTNVTLIPGEREIVILYNSNTATPTPPTNPPEGSPTPTATPTPIPSPTPTPIETEEFVIEDVAPAFGPETGEGDFLFILMGILLLAGAGLIVFRKKLLHSNQ